MGLGTSTGRVASRGLIAALGAAGMLVALPPGLAVAEPPAAIPAAAERPDADFQPAFDYDGDGCYPTPAIGGDGTLNPGLNPSGALNGNCHDMSDLDSTNSYSRAKCNNGWCAYMYGLYFEKDQAQNGVQSGHRHDWEHVVVWVKDGAVAYVAPSAHGDYDVKPAQQVAFDGGHPKIVYHKDGVGTHAFRFATGDEPPENGKRAWQRPALVSWGRFPGGLRDTLASADFGSATLALKDGEFAKDLAKAKPKDIPFDPGA